MNEKQVKELSKEIKELLPDKTHKYTLEATGDVEISYSDEDETLSKIQTKIDTR
jgi:hypothetical protein